MVEKTLAPLDIVPEFGRKSKNKQPTELGKKIRRLRYLRRWTQGDLAQLAGVNRFTISLIENGYNHASIATMTKLDRAFGGSVERLEG